MMRKIQNKTFITKIILILLFIWAVGVCSGSFFEVFMHGIGKDNLMESLTQFFSGSSSGSFWLKFFNCLKSWIIIIFVLSVVHIIPFGVVLSFFVCFMLPFLKGMALGFSATMLIETFGVKGSWYIISTIIPQNLIQVPILLIMIALSITASLLSLKNTLQNYARYYVNCYVVCFVLIIISCLIEAALT
jgi:stage II sporulation protein M